MAQSDSDLPLSLGNPCWMDLMSSDPEKSIAFYQALFGWECHDTAPDMKGYRYFTKNGKGVGGCMKNEPEWGAPDGWSIFLKTNDAAATAAAAQSHGGEVLMPPMTVEPNGTFTVVRDAGGAVISAWQAGTEPGFGMLGETGSPSHFELHTRDFDASLDFYRSVFGWDVRIVSDTPEFRYALSAQNEDDALAGVMDATAFLAEGCSPHWSVYIRSEDADATLSKAVELGGSIVAPAEDTPYGRLGVAADPTGGVFKVQG